LLSFSPSLLEERKKADSWDVLGREMGDRANIPSRVVTTVAESGEHCSRLAGNATKDDWGLRRSSTFEHTAALFSREVFFQIKVTGWLMTNGVITAATLPFFPTAQESNQIPQGGR
jgi:hypothetical protein